MPTYGHTYGDLWQFPALLKFRLPVPVVRPFVAAGPSVQLANGIVDSSYNIIEPSLITTVHLGPNAIAGWAAGGGFEFHAGPLIFAPEVRYTRWFSDNFDAYPGGGVNIGTHLNQVQVLLSIRI